MAKKKTKQDKTKLEYCTEHGEYNSSISSGGGGGGMGLLVVVRCGRILVQWQHPGSVLCMSQCCVLAGFTESLGLEKTFQFVQSNHQPDLHNCEGRRLERGGTAGLWAVHDHWEAGLQGMGKYSPAGL